ncbi:hypothetical protein CEXT_156461 [Caerostris extrusa]|uniref:Uncharacterized protein n=1 Tax=Caerostris extrusa TaxID=172846 RepID=A0AAV4TUU5_CAEEX|nr:hypothetical protein CEXT_156461 [Caerostris extrusa]
MWRMLSVASRRWNSNRISFHSQRTHTAMCLHRGICMYRSANRDSQELSAGLLDGRREEKGEGERNRTASHDA